MSQATAAVTMKGNPVTLLGTDVKVGSPAPDCTLVAQDLSEFKLSSVKGKTVIISVVPSLDTGICNLQTKRFNKEAEALGDQVKVLTISMDLPFAQKRWCGAANAENVIVVSDHRDAAFGQAYGLLIKGLRLLARAVLIVDANGTLRYKQIVPEITTEPDYTDALNALKKI
ncbi:MAG: thiol peroxidase [Candidatus Omnitrophica bacterium]|nr:thiol peroxidase [Candidatus Omnitrophota bacterium]